MKVTEIYVDYKANPRGEVDSQFIFELADSIRDTGLINPVTLKPSNPEITNLPYSLIAGFSRFYACTKILKYEDVPATITEADEALIGIEENLKRQDLTIEAEANALRAWHRRTGMCYPDIARKLNKSLTWMQPRLMLLDLDKEDQKKVKTVADVLALTKSPRSLAEVLSRHALPRIKKEKRTRKKEEMLDMAFTLMQYNSTHAISALNWAAGILTDEELFEKCSH